VRRHFPGGPVFEAVPEPGAVEPGPLSPDYQAPEPEPQPEPWYANVTEDDWNRVNTIAQQIENAQALYEQQQQQAQFQQQSQAVELDPLADDFQAQLDRYLDQRFAPFQHAQQSWEQSEGAERAHDILADNQAREGEFLLEGSSEKALLLAESYLPEMQQRHGVGPQAAEAAINAAASEIRDYERQVGEAYHTRQMNQLKTLNDAPREPGTAAPAVQTNGSSLPNVQAVLAKYGGWGH
jgi:hypothetical protein